MNAVYLVITYKFLNSYFYIHLIHYTNLFNSFNNVLKAKYNQYILLSHGTSLWLDSDRLWMFTTITLVNNSFHLIPSLV